MQRRAAGRTSDPGRKALRPYKVLAYRVLVLLTLGFALGPSLGPVAAQSSAAAQAAPDRLTLVGLEGGQLSEADLEQGVTLLVVWATWSPRCRDVAARIDALATSWSSRARVASVVFQEEPEAIRRFLDDKSLDDEDDNSLDGQELDATDLDVPVYIDTSGAFSKKHAVTTLPSLLVFDGGKTAFRGKLPADPGPVIERALTPDDG